jgi:hypothetical protein
MQDASPGVRVAIGGVVEALHDDDTIVVQCSLRHEDGREVGSTQHPEELQPVRRHRIHLEVCRLRSTDALCIDVASVYAPH